MSYSARTKKLGQNTAEYILMLALVAGAALASAKLLGRGIQNSFGTFIAGLTGTEGKDNGTDIGTAGKNLYDDKWDMGRADTNNARKEGSAATGAHN